MAYFSNGTEGMILDEQCAHCPVGKHPEASCPIILVQSVYNYEQLKDGNEKLREAMNALVNEKGICQMRKVMVEHCHMPETAITTCPRCFSPEVAVRHVSPSSGFPECWVTTCEKCGYDFDQT